MESKQTGTGYLLLGLSVFGVAGIHRFYLGRPVSGLLWFLTFGLFGVGSFVDLFLLPSMVREENLRLGVADLQTRLLASGSSELPAALVAAPPSFVPNQTPEQSILHAAKASDGCLTVAGASLVTGLPLRKAEKMLERLVKNGHAERDVNEEGARLYVFPGLRSSKPFDLDAV